MKCPKCNDEMMVLCRRDVYGFSNELYHKCLGCGHIPEEDYLGTEIKASRTPPWKMPKPKGNSWRWKAATATILASLVLVSIMQIPVPVRVFAMEVSVDPLKDILPYVGLVNFTISQFSLNYTEGQIELHVTADEASIISTETAPNVTTCKFNLAKVLIKYRDSLRTMDMGFAALSMAITIRYQELMAHIDATAYMPLWTAIVRQLTGQTP